MGASGEGDEAEAAGPRVTSTGEGGWAVGLGVASVGVLVGLGVGARCAVG